MNQMAKDAASFVLQQAFQFVVQEGTLLTQVGRDLKEIKAELDSIQALLEEEDTKAADDEGGANRRVKTWVKQQREASFRIEDIIDEYNMHVAQRVNHSGIIALLQNISHMILNLKSRYRVATEIRDIQLSVENIRKRSAPFDSLSKSEPSGSKRIKAASFVDPQTDSHLNDQVVGFESQRDELVRSLVGGTDELMLVSVVGTGGIGKTTLAKHVFHNQQVKRHFDHRFYIPASQSSTKMELLLDMMNTFSEDSMEQIPMGLKEMGESALTKHVRQSLEPKRYLVWFDDVCKVELSDWIADAITNNNRGSRIIVTTRMMHAAENFQTFFPDCVYVRNLNPLPHDKAYELFCKKAFRGRCPTELEEMSNEIVQKCGGLPLAIVTVGGILYRKPKTTWEKVSKNLGMELDGNARVTKLTTILSQSYDDLPRHLKSCMLYFGIYPENYTINCKRLTRQWISEGFVKPDKDNQKTLEKVAEEYLKELVQTGLVQVSSGGFHGKSCKVHNLLHHIIIRKMKDVSFCHIMHEDHEQVTVDVTRRFSIATFSNNVLRSNSNSGIRAIFVFDKKEFPEYFISSLSIKFRLIKVLDFAHSLLNYVPANLGSLFYLKYLNLSHTKVTVLPRSIGNLVNLETLDLRQTEVHELPMEINKLTKLRLLPVYYKRHKENYSTLNDTRGVKMQKGIGCLKSLQKLYFLEADNGGIVLIQELKMLTKLRKLGIRGVQKEHGNELCAAIQEMEFLESLNITAKDGEQIIDLDSVSAPCHLKVVNLKVRLTKFPDWIPKLVGLVKLMLGFCKFEHDPLDSLKKLTNLSWLILCDDAFAGDSLHFQVEGFPKLMQLDLTRLNRLSSVSIDRGALLSLEYFNCHENPQLKVLPRDLQNLRNLIYLTFADMPAELGDSIDPQKNGPCHQFINDIPHVLIRPKVEDKWRVIPTHLNV